MRMPNQIWAGGWLAVLLAASPLCGCVENRTLPTPESAFLDSAFAPPVERIDVSDLFATNETMRRYLSEIVAGPLRREERMQGLIDALHRIDRLRVEYDAERTRDAAETFAARKGNCLSLVIMTAALAKELDLAVTYQLVETEQTWSHTGDLAFLNTHVNLRLGPRAVDQRRGWNSSADMTIDFVPVDELRGARITPISESMIVAMYMNNRSAEALARGSIDDAYWWVRGALLHAPQFTTAYNTLGVIYLRHGNLPASEEVLRRMLASEPDDRQALSNLVLVLEGLNRPEEAGAIRSRLARLDPFPPFQFFFHGLEAMRRGDFREARLDFEREVERADYSSEFHFWLGIANLRLGRLEEARRQIQIAMDNSTTGADRKLYAAKLERLRARGLQ